MDKSLSVAIFGRIVGKNLPEVWHLFLAIVYINVADSHVIWCADVKYDVYQVIKHNIK